LQYYREGNYKDALAQYIRAIKLGPGDHNFYFAAARVYTQIGNSREAQANLQLAKKYASDPGDRLLYGRKLELLKSAHSLEDGELRELGF
jgi:tetratricopeptide (TPR) repeat protein